MATAIAIVGLGLSATSIYSGKRASKKAERNQKNLTAEQKLLDADHAANIKEQAAYEATKIRSEAITIRGRQIAQQASSGVLVGNGSARAMVDETISLAEEDAYITLYNGEKGYLNTIAESKLRAQEGRAKADSYRAQGNATLLAGASSFATQGLNLYNALNP